jgi:phosphatidylethanolamine/phosphatidyl-N-methylethanolamine N-methyltransferase
MRRIRQHGQFLWQFMRKPHATGAIAPSSARLAKMICAGMELHKADVVAEFGGGTGAFTRTIMEHVKPESNFLVFEINKSLARTLQRSLPQVDVITDSAANLSAHLESRGLSHVNSVVCGLPWAIFSEELQNNILSAMVDNMPPGGRFATFAYIHAVWFPAARNLRRRLQKYFSKVEASPIVWGNLPPAFVWHCTK